jgi:hypothetical protein
MTVNLRWSIAVHESAHACAAFVLGRPIYSIKLFADGTGEFRGSGVKFAPLDERASIASISADWKRDGGPRDLEWVKHHCIIALAGPCATARLAGAAAGRASGEMDIFNVRSLLSTLPLTDGEQAAKFDDANEQARQLVTKHWFAVRSLAAVVWAAGDGDTYEAQIRETLQMAQSRDESVSRRNPML